MQSEQAQIVEFLVIGGILLKQMESPLIRNSSDVRVVALKAMLAEASNERGPTVSEVNRLLCGLSNPLPQEEGGAWENISLPRATRHAQPLPILAEAVASPDEELQDEPDELLAFYPEATHGDLRVISGSLILIQGGGANIPDFLAWPAKVKQKLGPLYHEIKDRTDVFLAEVVRIKEAHNDVRASSHPDALYVYNPATWEDYIEFREKVLIPILKNRGYEPQTDPLFNFLRASRGAQSARIGRNLRPTEL